MKNLFKDPTFQVLGTAMTLMLSGAVLTMHISKQLHYIIVEDGQPRITEELALQDMSSGAEVFMIHFDGYTNTKVYTLDGNGGWQRVATD